MFSTSSQTRGGYLVNARSNDLPAIVARAGVAPELALTARHGEATRDIEIYRFQSGDRILLALLRDKGAPSGAEPVTLALPRPSYVQDMRAGNALGRNTRIPLNMTAGEPVILSLSDIPPAPQRAGP